jgi:hypothetical protein
VERALEEADWQAEDSAVAADSAAARPVVEDLVEVAGSSSFKHRVSRRPSPAIGLRNLGKGSGRQLHLTVFDPRAFARIRKSYASISDICRDVPWTGC